MQTILNTISIPYSCGYERGDIRTNYNNQRFINTLVQEFVSKRSR